MIRTCLSVALVAVAASPVWAVDLSKIDRHIDKEPGYRNAPKYCLLVFGPRADTRVWLVKDGNILYIDRNANGDLTDKGEKVVRDGSSFRLGDVRESDGDSVHTGLTVREYDDGCRIYVRTHRAGRQYVGYRDEDKTVFASSPKSAPIIHFDGPIVMAQYSTSRDIPRMDSEPVRNRSLRVMIGTPGLGKGTFAACTCTCRRKYGSLQVELTFPLDDQGNVRLVRRMEVKTFN